MQVTFCGTGSALPSSTRLQTGIHIQHKSHHLLVDCGSGVMHRLAQAGIDHRSVDTVLLTHTHLDHVADLATLAKARYLDGHPEFTVIGPPGTRTSCETLFAIDNLRDRVALTITEIDFDQRTIDLGPHTITYVGTPHTTQSLAYRFGDALTISGDTAPTPAVADMADGTEVFVHECSFTDDRTTETHTTPSALGELLETTGITVDRIVLTHLFPETEPYAETVRQTVSGYTDATVQVAADGTEISIG